MPKITDILDKQKGSKKKFAKKEYRPWNLGETLTSENQSKEEVVSEKPPVQVEEKLEAAKKESPKVVEQVVKEPIKTESENKKSEVEKSPVAQKVEIPSGFVKPDPAKVSVEDHLLQLSGRQRELLILIIRDLVDNKSLVTSPMYSENLVQQISTSLGTIKNAVRRLEGKGLIKSVSKRARGGYYRFEATEEVITIGQRLFFRP